MKNYKTKTSIVRHEGPRAQANKTGISLMIFILIFMESCLHYNAIHDFSVFRRTGSNQVDIKRFRSNTGKILQKNLVLLIGIK